MAETSQDSNQHLEQDPTPLSSAELSPDFDDVSEDTSSRQHERLQKLRTWWSKKAPTACMTFPNLSDSSDSDDDFDDDDVEDVIFPSARCRVMRVVGKLSTIQKNVQTIYRARYGPIDLEDMTCAINLRGQRIESLDDIQWGQVMLINSVDILQSKISIVRRLFLAYKMNMSKCKSDLNQDYMSQEDEVCLISTQSQKRDEVVSESGFASKRHKIVRLITPQHHHDVIYRFCSLFLYLIKPSLFPDRQSEIKRKVLLEDAFSKIRVIGLQDCLNDDSWNVLDRCHLPSPSIVSRCINLSTFFTMTSHSDDQSPIRTVTSECDVAQSPSSMISQYQDIINYFKNTALFCAYMFRRLKVLEQELCVASKHFGEMRDKRIKNCKPLSDGDELLRRVMMKGEAVLEMNEIAHTSSSPEECRAKRFMIKGILRIEKRAENLMYRFASWRRSREFPSPRRTANQYQDGMRKTKPEPMESRVFYQTTFNGLIIKRFCIARDSLVRKAFSRSTIGLNDALLVASKPNFNSSSKQMRSMRFKGNSIF